MAASSSSSGSRRYDVFPSFSGEDVRKGFLSYLLMAFNRRSINSFIDNGIERSRPIGPELISAIREARISIVIFSKNYAASTWCLNELAVIHNCYKDEESNQMVIPVFYNVDPSEVRKQNGEFGESFMKTCVGTSDDQKQRWIQALTNVANLAGEHLQNWPTEADMVEKIADDVSNKLIPPSNGLGDFVGIEAHIKEMESILCLESMEARMVGIWGQSGIGKSTLGRALFNRLSPKFPFRNLTTYKCADQLSWEQNFLSEILGQKNLKIENSGVVKERLKDKKVLIVLDDVFDPLFLETLVGKTAWFGPGSRIIVITQDKHILRAHDIDFLYEVKIPAPDIALTILCRSAFDQDSPPDDFKELAVEVAKVAGDLPLGLRVLGKSLKGRKKEEWIKLLPGLKNGLKGGIMKILKVSYGRLDKEEQDLFLWVASLFNGMSVKSINDFFGYDNGGLERLAEKSLIRITPKKKIYWKIDGLTVKIVEIHNLLEKLGREIVRAESKSNLGKRRFLTDAKEIQDVLTNQTGTKTVLGMFLKASAALETCISIDEKSFQVMFNLQFLKIDNGFFSRMDESKLRLVYLPRKLKYLEWYGCPLKCLPSNFKTECLVELKMENSKLEKLWEGSQKLGSLKTIKMSFSKNLKEIPDLSKAINLERVDFSYCDNLEIFPNLSKSINLERVDFSYCENLEIFPSLLNSESLEYLSLVKCPRLKNFPQILMESLPHGIEIKVYDCLWNKNLHGLDYLDCLRRCYPRKFLPEHIVQLKVKGTTMEKLWEGTQSLGSLKKMDLSWSGNLKEIPDLSKAINLTELYLYECKSLLTLPSTIGNLQKLEILNMENCTGLEVLPVDVNLSSVKTLDLQGCSSLKSFPQISNSIEELNLDFTAIEEVPCLTEMLPRLIELSMRGCSSLTSFPQLPRSIKELDLDLTAIEEVPCLIEMLPRLIVFSMCGCSSLKSFPRLPRSIERLYLEDTTIEEVPCCIMMFWRLTSLSMRRCNELKNISANIFRLTNLKKVDFEDCEGVITTLSDSTVVATMDDTYENIEKGNKVEKDKDEDPGYFNFGNCLKLDRDARELIIQSSFKSVVVLPGGELPTYFNHRAYGNSLTVTLPQSSLFHEFLRFNVCVVVKPSTDKLCWETLHLHFCFSGVFYKHVVDSLMCSMPRMWKTDHLVLCSFKIRTTGLPSTLDFNNVEFKLKFKHDILDQKDSSRKIKEVGIRVLNVSTSLDDRDGRRSSETECITPSGETESSKKQMQISSIIDTSFSQNMELPLGQRGESSSVPSYPYLEGEALCIDSMITEQQDAQIPIVDIWPVADSFWWPLRKSEENLNLPFDRIVTDTGLISPNLELTLGRGESSSVSSFPCPEREALCIDSMINEQQDAQIPIVDYFNLPYGQTALTSPNLELTLGWGDSSSVSSYPCPEGEALCKVPMITEH